MVATATTTSVLFNITTNGNAQLLAERLDGLVNDPARLGMLLAGVYAVASLAQLVVGRLLDRVPSEALVLLVSCFFKLWLLGWRRKPLVGFGILQPSLTWSWFLVQFHSPTPWWLDTSTMPCAPASAVRALPFRLVSARLRFTCLGLW